MHWAAGAMAAVPAYRVRPPWLLSQGTDGAVFEGLLWFAGLVLVALLLLPVLGWLKRRLRKPDESRGAGFTLDQLRDLQERGELTSEEYQTLRRKLLEGH